MSVVRANGGALPFIATGRTLTFYTVSLANVHTGYAAVDSDFEKLVRAIETLGSIELLGTPAAGAFRVAITGAAPSAGDLQTLLAAAVATTTVAAFTL